MNFAEQDGVIWLDGEYVPWKEAKVHVLTHTLHYGLGVYEGVRAYKTDKGPAFFRLGDHLERLYRSAKIVNMKVPYETQTLNEVAVSLMQKNDMEAAYLRPMCFYGSEGMGLHCDKLETHVVMAVWPWGEYLGEGSLNKGIRVKISSFARNHVNSLMPKAKANGHYVNSMLALNEAQLAGFNEALMLDHQGYIAEGSGENFFMVHKGVVYTPPLTNILDGITRDTICVLCKELDIPLVERNITRDELYFADEAFFTGTAAEVTPIVQVDSHILGNGNPGPISSKLQAAYFDQVFGRDHNHSEWLTYINN